ncbi:MAG: hypothetical protein CL678_17920 [Bdellovibrionaceae bacterium]|nr:hypothetical protein [Pseudobdellovibrionaceae bacterium]|tara:strand:+ start:1842 stop:3095 length:1254 start_codon:yes stop_codon:yes gene_type:complete
MKKHASYHLWKRFFLIQVSLFIFFILSLGSFSKKIHEIDFMIVGQFEKQFEIDLPGRLTDLKISSSGQRMLAATVPDFPGNGENISKPHLQLLNSNGKVLWSFPLKARVRDLGLSFEGKLNVISTYEDKLIAYDQQGKEKWTYPGMCYPYVQTLNERVICYYDDDSRPRTAFVALSFDGKKILEYPTSADVLTFDISRDERWILMGLDGGKVQLLSPELKSLWTRSLGGQPMSVTLSNSAEPKIAVLYLDSHQSKKVSVFSLTGELLQDAGVPFSISKIVFSSTSESLLFYGNSKRGQEILSAALFHLNEMKNFDENPRWVFDWSYQDTAQAHYSSRIQVLDQSIVLGFEGVSNRGEKARRFQLFSFRSNGKVKWTFPVQSMQGYYLFDAHQKQDDETILYISGDHGKIFKYFIKEG